MKFNEDSRVKTPTIPHLMRLGYEYLSLKNPVLTQDESTNIFTDVFHASIKRMNPELSDLAVKQCFDDEEFRPDIILLINGMPLVFIQVHRSYNPKDSFLANLEESDRNSIKTSLTGTPLLVEVIETSYKLILQKHLKKIKILKGNADKKLVYAHSKFVEPILDYIVKEFEQARIAQNNVSLRQHSLGLVK